MHFVHVFSSFRPTFLFVFSLFFLIFPVFSWLSPGLPPGFASFEPRLGFPGSDSSSAAAPAACAAASALELRCGNASERSEPSWKPPWKAGKIQWLVVVYSGENSGENSGLTMVIWFNTFWLSHTEAFDAAMQMNWNQSPPPSKIMSHDLTKVCAMHGVASVNEWLGRILYIRADWAFQNAKRKRLGESQAQRRGIFFQNRCLPMA